MDRNTSTEAELKNSASFSISNALAARPTTHRIYAPYAKRLVEAIKRGEKLRGDITIFLGKDAWRIVNEVAHLRPSLLIPLEDNDYANKYRWDFVRNFPILIKVTSADVHHQSIRRLALELLSFGAAIVRVLLTYTDPPTFFQFERKRV